MIAILDATKARILPIWVGEPEAAAITAANDGRIHCELAQSGWHDRGEGPYCCTANRYVLRDGRCT